MELGKIAKNSRYKKVKIYLHVHPFVAAYINSGFFSIKNKWVLKYKRSITVIPRDSYLYLEYHFFNNDSKLIK